MKATITRGATTVTLEGATPEQVAATVRALEGERAPANPPNVDDLLRQWLERKDREKLDSTPLPQEWTSSRDWPCPHPSEWDPRFYGAGWYGIYPPTRSSGITITTYAWNGSDEPPKHLVKV